MSPHSSIPVIGRTSSGDSLPGDHVALTARRLAVTTAVAGAVHLVYIVLYRTALVAASSTVGMLSGIAGLVVSVAATAYLVRGAHAAARVAFVAIAYEIFLASGAAEGAPAGRRRATTVELEGLYGHMERVLLDIGYLHRANPSRMMRVFRRLLGRAGPDEREVRALRGILRQITWYGGGKGAPPHPDSKD